MASQHPLHGKLIPLFPVPETINAGIRYIPKMPDACFSVRYGLETFAYSTMGLNGKTFPLCRVSRNWPGLTEPIFVWFNAWNPNCS
jgi:hypothetical protein